MIPAYEFESEEAKEIPLNQLTFSYTFEHEHDTTFFAHFQPYSLNDLQDFLFQTQNSLPEEHLDNILKVQKLCDSLSGNPCLCITITKDVKTTDVNPNALS